MADDPEKALDAHREGLGPVWTQIHRLLLLVESTTFVEESELDTYVKKYMVEYGMDHVRGGSWEQVRWTDSDRQRLCKELTQDQTRYRGCMIC